MRLSIRADATHGTRVLLDQTLAADGLSLADLESWGCSFHYVSAPADPRRIAALHAGELDAIFDEGIRGWFPVALECGLQPIMPSGATVKDLQDLGWRHVVIKAGRFPGLKEDCEGIDFSGWPMYTRAALSDDEAYELMEALDAGGDEVPWEETPTPVNRLGSDADDTPLDVPLHPGAARWYKEHGR